MRKIFFGLPLFLLSLAFAQNQPPVAVITVLNKTIANNQITVTRGEQVQFIGSKSIDPEGASLSYFWEFGDGQTSTLAVPKHTYLNAGTYTVKLTVDDGFITPPPPGPNPLYPNQPTGFNRIMETDFSVMLPSTVVYNICAGPGIFAGCWGRYPAVTDKISIVNDGTAPRSPGGVFQFKYATGQTCGNSPGGQFSARATPEEAEMREFYESNWFKIPSADFENLPLQMKMFGYWGVAASKGTGATQIYATINSASTIASSFRLDMVTQSNPIQAPGPRRFYPNTGKGGSFTCGSWHRFELYMKLNDVNNVTEVSGAEIQYRSNGIMIVWIDGVMTHNFTDVAYVKTNSPRGFFGRDWNPIYGGGCGTATKTRNDYVWIDHLYMSGIPK